jgi:hypothetical protein
VYRLRKVNLGSLVPPLVAGRVAILKSLETTRQVPPLLLRRCKVPYAPMKWTTTLSDRCLSQLGISICAHQVPHWYCADCSKTALLPPSQIGDCRRASIHSVVPLSVSGQYCCSTPPVPGRTEAIVLPCLHKLSVSLLRYPRGGFTLTVVQGTTPAQ